VAGAFGQTIHENPSVRLDEVFVSDISLVKQRKGYLIKASLLHTIQQKVKNDQMNLEQMYSEIMSAITERKM
jgi:hypothetical protein